MFVGDIAEQRNGAVAASLVKRRHERTLDVDRLIGSRAEPQVELAEPAIAQVSDGIVELVLIVGMDDRCPLGLKLGGPGEAGGVENPLVHELDLTRRPE